MKKSATTPAIIEFKDCHEFDAVCPHDGLHFSSMEQWKKHHVDHHMEDHKWACPLCGEHSSSWYNYSYHVQTSKHKSICLPAWNCKLSFEDPTFLSGTIPCDARYGSKYQLIRHIRKSHPNCEVSTHTISARNLHLISLIALIADSSELTLAHR